ncbi:signal transduction histidine kinase [Paraburkholderia sp. BL6669N2]|uniref:sensor histidine kinase n=1 Tax=Paraburkholderia sp. BL6669N2 TaxID=1938807 RepID=UPI000E24B4CC|nr:ATP-binding protein [Paraburkholderia sp. BL6669N2]REG52214.1 signal transduction histidine kinase [Paraburkholderia sp. BL6669N2]
MRLTDLHRTTSFRLATLFLAMFGVVSLLLFAYLYFEITGFEIERVDDWLQREYAAQVRVGTDELVARFNHQSQFDPRHQRPFALFDAQGKHIAGGLPGDRPELPYFDRPFSTRLELPEQNVPARCIAARIRDGRTALLCQNTRELDHFDEELLHALVSAGVLMLFTGLIGAAIVGGGAMRRLDAVTQSIEEIVAGNLSRRLPVHAKQDDIDRLVRVVNGMLDEIERLMQEVKGVCDAIAHDLRTPLTRLMAGLDRAQRRAASEEEYRAATESAVVELAGILGTFNALLRISEIESNARHGNFVTVDLAAVVDDVIEFYEPTAEEKGVTLEYRRAASGSIELQGDRNLLFEAIANVVENAIKFAPEGGHVSVDVLRDGAGFGITIADDGPGISPDERQAVLRRFYRGEASRHTPGNGLGLSLTHAVAGMHGMSIRFNDVPTGCSVTLLRNARPAIIRTVD